ncbi:hypothetical protein C8Q78DRAFT_331587 [Trametes maxima]|nr:hypothetical protein C8Q78DRAFT_331587 [Trametes maxima]
MMSIKTSEGCIFSRTPEHRPDVRVTPRSCFSMGLYTTDVGVFHKLLPFAPRYNARIIVLNRRDYNGATPYTPADRALLPPHSDTPRTDEEEIRSVRQSLETFMRDRARELYEHLQALVVSHNIPPAGSRSGGIVLVGWSLSVVWTTAFLCHVASFSVGKVELHKYVRRVVLHDPFVLHLGYPVPADDPFNPYFDTSLSQKERNWAFAMWVHAYYGHGNTLDELRRRDTLDEPPPTVVTIPTGETPPGVPIPPGAFGGSDSNLVYGCAELGVFGTLRKGTLFPSEDPRGRNHWANVEVLHVWGDHSVWEVPYAVWAVREELCQAKKAGRAIRPVSTLRLRGANHHVSSTHTRVYIRVLILTSDVCRRPHGTSPSFRSRRISRIRGLPLMRCGRHCSVRVPTYSIQVR